MKNEGTLLSAGLEHLDGLLAIEEACFAHPWSRAALEGELAREDACILCVQEGQTVAAYGSMRILFEEAEIGNIACLPSFRGQGLGGRVLDGLIARAKESGCERMLLEVRPSNEVAIGLYRSRGFEDLGRRKNFYRDPTEDALMMALSFQ